MAPLRVHKAWAKFLYHNFKACYCNGNGSYGISCDVNGVCSCKANIINSKCDICQDGFYNFPNCEGKQNYMGLELSWN